jgi:predicted permease
MVTWRYVTPAYFSTLGISILRGRSFTERDRDANAYAVVLSNSLAQRLFPGEDALGKRILRGPQGQWFTVTGIAADVKNMGPANNSQPEYYLLRKPAVDFVYQSHEPPTGWRSASVIARTAIDPKLVAGSIRGVVASLDPTLPVQMETMPQRLQQITQRPRFNAVMLTLFAGMGLVLAAIGLFGVMSFLVAQRTREIGVRMALGATPGDVLWSTIKESGRWTAAGLIAGVIGSIIAARLLRSLLFQVEPGDPRVIAGAVLVLCAVAALATLGPARRAARLDPMTTLRQE